jgi:hypothetical protein
MKMIRYCLVPALLLSSQAALADGPRWRVTETSGGVQVMRSGLSSTASRGSMLYSGDVIVTGDRGRAVVTRGEEYMIVSPGTRLRLPGDTRAGGITRIIEEVGNVIYNVQRRNHEHFGVETPYLAAVVKGTTFSVTVSPEGSSVQVLEGLVEVSTLDGGATQLVEPGSVALVAAGNRYQLTVEGNDTQVIDSPNAPAEGDEGPVVDGSDATPRVTLAYTGPPVGNYGNQIVNEIRANPVSIGTLTGGFMGGQTEVGAEFSAAIESSSGSSELNSRGPDGNNGIGVGGNANAGGNGNGGNNGIGIGVGGNANAGGNGNGGNNGIGIGVGGSANAGGGNGVTAGVGGSANAGGGNGVTAGVGGSVNAGGGNGVTAGVGVNVGGGSGVDVDINVGVGGSANGNGIVGGLLNRN